MTEYRGQPPDMSETLSRLEPGSLAASVAHSAALVLGVHRRDADGRCARPGCDHPCVIASYAEKCQKLAAESTDVRALLDAQHELDMWVMRHVNPGEST